MNGRRFSPNPRKRGKSYYHHHHEYRLSNKYIFSTSFMPCGKLGSPYLGQVAAARAALPIPNLACSIFVSPLKRYCSDWFGSLTGDRCSCMRLHTKAVQTPEKSALKVDYGRKVPCHTWESNPSQRCAGPTLSCRPTNWATSSPPRNVLKMFATVVLPASWFFQRQEAVHSGVYRVSKTQVITAIRKVVSVTRTYGLLRVPN